jgi:large subunit ribosomal protein L35
MLKTKKGVTKRFKVSKRGKVLFGASGKSHLLTNKNRKRLRKLKHGGQITEVKEKRFLKLMMPYGL